MKGNKRVKRAEESKEIVPYINDDIRDDDSHGVNNQHHILEIIITLIVS